MRNGVIKPVYFLYGKEQMLVNESQQLIARHALADHERDFNLTIVYGGDVEPQAILAECAAYPAMAQRRVVIVRQFEQMDGNDSFMAYAKKPNPTTVLILVSGAGIKSNPYNAISKAAETFNFESVPERKIPGWVSRRVQELNYKISGEAADMMAYLVGTDLQTLSNEVDKLVNFCGERRDITSEDVLEVTGHSSEFNVFQMQKSVVARDFIGSERILDRMLQVSSNKAGTAIMTVTVLASYFTKLLKLSGCQDPKLSPAEVAKKIGVPVYYLREYQSALRMLGSAGLDRAGLTLLGADYELKGGSDNEEKLILTLMLRRLTGTGHRNNTRATA